MPIKIFPTKFEAYDDIMQEPVFNVEAVDDCTATVKISTIVDVSMWDEISPKIRQCLVDMKLNE